MSIHMNIIDTLNEKLLEQNFNLQEEKDEVLAENKKLAQSYALLENAVAVLSDLRNNRSYVYHSSLSKLLDLPSIDNKQEINTIWEADIFALIHPDDLMNKHILELQFFNYIQQLDTSQRAEYNVYSVIRMRTVAQTYRWIRHRMFYIYHQGDQHVHFALCLYSLPEVLSPVEGINSFIFHATTGNCILPNQQELQNLLSVREKQILGLIRQGQISKEIAANLSISVNTVNRHRQNILEKLRVKNSVEALLVAERLQFL